MKRIRPYRDEAAYRVLWRIVDGAVADAFNKHPDYLTDKGAAGDTARRSINKRVVGALKSFAEAESLADMPVQAECSAVAVTADEQDETLNPFSVSRVYSGRMSGVGGPGVRSGAFGAAS